MLVLCQKAFKFGSLTTMLTQNTLSYLMRGGGGGDTADYRCEDPPSTLLSNSHQSPL